MNNLHKSQFLVSRNDRCKLTKQKGHVIWFYGLSGSGKSTLAKHLEVQFHNQGKLTYVLDGDNVRSGLNSDLKFSNEDRSENIRRCAELAKLFVDASFVVLVAFITPFEKDRKLIRSIIGSEDITLIYVNCPLEKCKERDVKGLYEKVNRGEIKNFTGIDSPFEVSDSDISVDTYQKDLEECILDLEALLEEKL